MTHGLRPNILLTGLLAVVLVIAAAIVVLPRLPNASSGLPGPIGMDAVIQFGEGSLATAVTDRLRSAGVKVLSENEQRLASVAVPPGTAIVFDGAWFAARRELPEIRSLLTRIMAGGTAVVVIGDETSILLDVLEEEDIAWFPDGRNPAYMNPPQVGVRLLGEGSGRYPARLFSNSSDPDVLVDALSRWHNDVSQAR